MNAIDYFFTSSSFLTIFPQIRPRKMNFQNFKNEIKKNFNNKTFFISYS